MMKQSYQAYKEQSVMTMTPAEMLTMLYDGILKEMYLVKKALDHEPVDFAEVNRGLQKAHRILLYLKSSLDTDYDIANNLLTLYDYFDWIITQANVKKEGSGLDEIIDMVTQLKDSYIQADKSIRMHA